MTNPTENPAVEKSIVENMNSILPGNKPLEGLDARHEGGLEYTVISVRDGKPSIQWVELGPTPECTCSDFKGNRAKTFGSEIDAEREPCAHIVKAFLADQMEPEQLATRELINTTATIAQAGQEAREAAQEARSTARELDNGLVNVRDAQAEQAARDGGSPPNDTTSNGSNPNNNQNGSGGSGGSNGSHSNDDAAAEAAEKLQSAFDDVVEGMAVEYSEGMVWVNKTPGAPETLPGPGNVEVFQAFLQNPDQLQYVHDDHDYAGAAPGQYFNNMIDPSDVDEYISEVLQ